MIADDRSHRSNLPPSTVCHLLNPMNPAPPYRVLFICMGNICRSPAGENTFRHLVENAGLAAQITCDSAGTHDYHPGHPPDRRMSAALAARGIPTDGAARQFRRADFAAFNLILTMDEDNHRIILALAHFPEEKYRVQRFTDFCQSQAPLENQAPLEIPDPYYGGADGFTLVADLMADGCARLLAQLQRELG